MIQQINLLNSGLRKQRDLLSAIPLTIAAGVLLLLVLAVSSGVRQRAGDLEAAADKRAAELKASQAHLVELGKTVSEIKPSPELAEELANSTAMLNLRTEVIALLESGTFNSNRGYSEFMRGFARQVPESLWLTGFVLYSNGNNLEIHGRMLKPTALPEFIRRLNGEKVFQGLSFSSLSIDRPVKAVTAPTAQSQSAAASETSNLSPFVEFLLKSPPTENQASAMEGSAHSRSNGGRQ